LHSTKKILYLCINKFMFMQVNDKYRFVLVIALIMGFFLLITISGTVRKNMKGNNIAGSEYPVLSFPVENSEDDMIQNAGFSINENDTLENESGEFENKQEMKILF
jgi:hypothetical protein